MKCESKIRGQHMNKVLEMHQRINELETLSQLSLKKGGYPIGN